MVFECQSTWNWNDIDELISKYPCLKEYDVKMADKVSDYGHHYNRIEIKVNTLEDLIELSKKVGHPLVIDSRDLNIEIYDSWRE